ncbi:isocitrate lyase/PEP mutase family protein [Kribbella solani]|uniref:isocitrate lyase/PEP mutase family protein n=1 Tax=Kribbella solani TaxID=236067 RepID=UPI0029A9B951|nr:isocitrate lyase/PEP mutase family protein [Kribbella solani]MDX2972730.1 isocitrate lyase/PEP mutase family protein [Kribbella solani]
MADGKTAGDRRRRLRELLAGPDIVLAPSCGDAVTARLIESVGMPAVHCSGSVLHHLAGYADAGILTLTETVDAIRRVVDAVELPVIADADTGFGGVANVARTVREYERAGVAALHLEDQRFPKRPAYLEGVEPATVGRRELVDRIRVAVDARTDDSLLIIARSEFKGDLGEVLDRLGECVEAGADAVWLAARTPEDIAKTRAALDKPLIGVLPKGMSVQRFAELGADAALLPGWLLTAALHAQRALLTELRDSGSLQGYIDRAPGIAEARRFESEQGAAELADLEKRFGG